MITQKRVWELMSKECRFRLSLVSEYKRCSYYGGSFATTRPCECTSCPALAGEGKEINVECNHENGPFISL